MQFFKKQNNTEIVVYLIIGFIQTTDMGHKLETCATHGE